MFCKAKKRRQSTHEISKSKIRTHWIHAGLNSLNYIYIYNQLKSFIIKNFYELNSKIHNICLSVSLNRPGHIPQVLIRTILDMPHRMFKACWACLETVPFKCLIFKKYIMNKTNQMVCQIQVPKCSRSVCVQYILDLDITPTGVHASQLVSVFKMYRIVT